MGQPATDNLQFPCKSCGAKLAFQPGAAQLQCGYCGHTEAIPQTAGEVQEREFQDYKPDSSGYGVELKHFQCQQCGAQTGVEPNVTSFACAFCGSNQVVPQEKSESLHKPESLVPFAIEQREVLDRFKEWIKGLWFRPGELKKQARPDKVRGIYLPFWTYDTLTMSWWTAEAGHHYYEEDSDGNRVQRTRWERCEGRHNEFFDDVLIQASPTVDAKLIGQLEPFDTTKLVDYKPDYLSGKGAEDYKDDMATCWPRAKSRIDSKIESECSDAVPGDTQRGLSVQTSYLNRTYKLVLLPIWVASYRYQNKPYTYMVNGQTGQVAGYAPWSWLKIASFVLSIVAVIAGLIYLGSN